MGAIGSTPRWSPAHASGHHDDGGGMGGDKRDGGGGGACSPSASTSDLTDDGHRHPAGVGRRDRDPRPPPRRHPRATTDHPGTSGVLTGTNAPPLYDACLVGDWDEVLSICRGEPRRGGHEALESEEEENRDDPGGRSDDGASPTAATAACSASGGDGSSTLSSPGSPGEHKEDMGGDERLTPREQAGYADRRRNTPLHLACRRQPPPSVVRALLGAGPPGSASARTDDGLTPLHFASYCGAGGEAVGMLADAMEGDAAAAAIAGPWDCDRWEEEEEEEEERWWNRRSRLGHAEGGCSEAGRVPPPPSSAPPAVRRLDRRLRTPLHLALSGFRTPSRPSVVRRLLLSDPGSATLADERGRTPLALLHDDYAEEVAEALEGDVTGDMVRERIEGRGELGECWEMLRLLLRAAHGKSVEGDEDEEKDEGMEEVALGADAPQDKSAERDGSRHHFSMVHAAAAVWECPPNLVRLVLKVHCGRGRGGCDEDLLLRGAEDGADRAEGDGDDPVRTTDGTGRLPLHLAACARPASVDDNPARARTWRSGPPPTGGLPARCPPSQSSLISGVTSLGGSSLLTHPGGSGRRPSRVYNPHFSRDDGGLRDGVAAMSAARAGPRAPGDDGTFSSVGSVTSALGRAVRERTFLTHTAVRDVLELHPRAALVVDPATGRLPAVSAVESGKSYECAVGPLLDAYPGPFSAGGAGDDGEKHRSDLVGALLGALSSPDGGVRSEAVRTAGRLAGRGGWLAEPNGLDPLVSDWLDAAAGCRANDESDDRPAAVVGPGAVAHDPLRTLASILAALAEVLSSSRPGSVSDDVARRCLDAGRSHLSDPDLHVREAAARVLGSTLDAVGDRDDASNVVREVVLGAAAADGDSGPSPPSSPGWGLRDDGAVVRHGRLLACNSILSTRWGASLMADRSVGPAIVSSVRSCMRDRTATVRAAACRAVGPVLGKSLPPCPALDASRTSADECPRGPGPASSSSSRGAGGATTLRELRGDILRATRAGESADVQLALARGLTRATRIMPDLFLCRTGMPVMDAALMLAISGSSGRDPEVRRAFQVFLWSALRMGSGGPAGEASDRVRGGEGSVASAASVEDEAFTPQLMRYIALAEGENGASMVKFVTQTLAKLEDMEEA